VSGLCSSLVDTIGWMLLHSLWQGAAVAMALGLALHLLRTAPAQARYLAACVGMALMIVLPVTAVGRPNAIRSVIPAPRARDAQLLRADEPADLEVCSAPALRPWRTRIVPIFPAIVGLWMTGAGVLSLRLLGGWVLARQWVRRDTRPLVCPSIDRLKERMGIRRAVALLESARVEVPMVSGWLRPAILVPVAALSGLTAPQLEAILAHELAHIRRHDYLVNLLQCVVEILMFHQPATWWITRVIRREREHCCDDMAVAANRDRLTYAQALAAMEGLRTPAFSLSPAANGGKVLARVRRILKPEEESMKPVRMLLGLVVVLAVTSIWLTRADDQSAKANPRSTPPPMDRPQAFPNRSFADILAEIEAAPTGRLMIDAGTQPPADLDKINDAEAEKTFNVGMYYKRIGKSASAEFYFGKILQRWPNGPWAVKAKAQLQANPKPANRTRVEFFNFLLGGFY
jgi:beta-lactamase regulating signal transducer with metallopeptidase domain